MINYDSDIKAIPEKTKSSNGITHTIGIILVLVMSIVMAISNFITSFSLFKMSQSNGIAISNSEVVEYEYKHMLDGFEIAIQYGDRYIYPTTYLVNEDGSISYTISIDGSEDVKNTISGDDVKIVSRMEAVINEEASDEIRGGVIESNPHM